MSAVDCSVVDGDVLRTNAWLRIDLVALAAEQDATATAELTHELASINGARPATDTRVYLGRDASGRLVCFALTRWQPLPLAGKSIPAVQLVLTVATHGSVGSQALAVLLDACRDDLAALHQQPSQPPVLWSTARSPLEFLNLASHLQHSEPRYDGSYSLRGARIVRAVRQQLGAGLGDADDHPFVLRGPVLDADSGDASSRNSVGPRYSLFDQLGVDGAHADRLIVIATPPPALARRVAVAAASRLPIAPPSAAQESRR